MITVGVCRYLFTSSGVIRQTSEMYHRSNSRRSLNLTEREGEPTTIQMYCEMGKRFRKSIKNYPDSLYFSAIMQLNGIVRSHQSRSLELNLMNCIEFKLGWAITVTFCKNHASRTPKSCIYIVCFKIILSERCKGWRSWDIPLGR